MGHLARIGLVSLHLQGRVLINQDRLLDNGSHDEEPKTLGDLLFNTYRDVVAGSRDVQQPVTIEGEEA